MTTSGQRCASDGTSKTYAGTQTAVIQIIRVAHHVNQRKTRRRMMIVREISPKWFRLDAEGLVFFGYTKEQVWHKYQAWIRQYDLRRMR